MVPVLSSVCICAAPQLFQVMGWGVKASLLNSCITNSVNLVMTFVAMGLVDK